MIDHPRPGQDALPKLAVALDVGPAVHQQAGLSRYAEQLAANLLAHHQDELELRLVYNAHSGHRLPEGLAGARAITLPLGQRAWRLSVLASQVSRVYYASLTRQLRRMGACATVYHASEHLLPRLPLPMLLTVHDLIFERYPQHHTLANRLFLRVGMPLFVKAANRIIAVSQQTARDLQNYYQVDPQCIQVVPEGVDSTFRPAGAHELAAIRDQYSPNRPYLLMVGTLEPRKNHLLALAALARLKAQGFPHRLVIAGAQGWLFAPVRAKVEALDLAGDVVFPGYVPSADLPRLYAAADCLLMPSLYEGFGFPVLEAMACGTPVVCARASSLPEVAGDAALLAPIHDEEAFTAAIALVLTQPALASALRARGLARADAFTWERCARQTVDVYRTVAEEYGYR
jgi:glycosyltransferase involved in cell wall biosynthesis